MSAPLVKPVQLFHGIVKQVNSGDSIIMRSATNNNEKQVMLAQINSARLGRNLKPSSPDSTIEPDQPYSFEAREWLRKKCIGKEVVFAKEASTNTGTDRGTLYLGTDVVSGENLNEGLIAAGLVEVRRLNKPSEEENRLVLIEDEAKSKKLGKWSGDSESNHVRNVKYSVENAKTFVDSLKQKPIDAIIEYVRDGSTLRCLLLPSMHNITLQLSGVKCPAIKFEQENEPFADEAKQFVESRLLQRDVQVILEGVANQSNGILLGTVLHPNGNMSEFLLREGLAKCVDWSMGVVSVGAQKYRDAEKAAKIAKIRLWKNYSVQTSSIDEASKNLSGKVIEVSNGDSITIKHNDTIKKLFISSIRPPRPADFVDLLPPVRTETRKNNQLYDVPFLFEAREFLRKKLVGKKVNCTVDYIQPKQDAYPEKVCCTIMLGETNVGEALVAQGLAKVIRYKQDDDQRSSKYDDLLTAEARAQKKCAGVHTTKPPTLMKINDTSNDSTKTKQLLPHFQRLGRIDAVCEYVTSGSRLRLYLPKETCLITCLLSGIDCPRLGRPASGNMPAQSSDAFAEEAFQFTKSKTFQHEVKVEIEGIDKGGSFIGNVFTEDGTNISASLVELGYAAVHKTAANSPYFTVLNTAETKAKTLKLNRWKNYTEEQPIAEKERMEPTERVVAQKKIVITEMTSELHFYGQFVENGPKLEKLMIQLRAELEARPAVPGSYTPKVNDICVAQFSMDEEWYRAKVLNVKSNGQVTVLFIDYGNKEVTSLSKLAAIPAGFETLPAQAQEYGLAMVQVSADEDEVEMAIELMKEYLGLDSEPEFSINVEYKVGNVDFVTLTDCNKIDIGKKLVSDGLVSVDRQRREKRLQKLLTDYLKTLSVAKSAHLNMWRYGDAEQDDANEFGVSKK